MDNKPYRLIQIILFLISLLISQSNSLKHLLHLTDDPRSYATVSSFGFLKLGKLDVVVHDLILWPDPSETTEGSPEFGFVLIKSPDHMTNPFLNDPEAESDERVLSCMANSKHSQSISATYKHFDILTMGLNPNNSSVLVRCTGDNKLPSITSLPEKHWMRHHSGKYPGFKRTFSKRAATVNVNMSQAIGTNDTSKRLKDFNDNHEIIKNYDDSNYEEFPERRHRNNLDRCANSDDLPLKITETVGGRRSYSFTFTMTIMNEDQEGFYYLMFHNCRGLSAFNHNRFSSDTPARFNLSMLIYETNYPDIYLSAGSIPLPQMYFILSVMFFLIGCIWVNFIARQKGSSLRIHHLMTVLVFAKACSLLFHGINYHYISMDGQPVVTWAYLYYATRSLKGALFFITLALIGSGWTFIKNILSDKDKKIIVFIVGLQIIAHIAEIVLDESIEGQISYEVSAQIYTLVDLICCLAILYPISLSVRHLEEASRTDGKAAINLRKLELFKKFYIISTVYIYITRIVSFIFLLILSFKYSWLADLVSELSTLIYFITTGYYFQPMPTNPYLLLSSEQLDLEEDILFSMDGRHEIEMESTNALSNEPLNRDKEALLDNDDGERKVTRRIIDDIV